MNLEYHVILKKRYFKDWGLSIKLLLKEVYEM